MRRRWVDETAQVRSVVRAEGTRFLIFPQPSVLPGFADPVTMSLCQGQAGVGAGPEDDRIRVVDPIGKPLPYGIVLGRGGLVRPFLPPWSGDQRPSVQPDADGHFDHLAPGQPGFAAAHAYACARFTLDVWERHCGERLEWHFSRDYDRLEITLLPGWDNAQAGWGFLELGGLTESDGNIVDLALNFDVIAHEMGHLIVFARMGMPDFRRSTDAYFCFHEAIADIMAMLSACHVDKVLDQLLHETRGNLYTLNELNRIGELSVHDQIRVASNDVRMGAFRRGWRDEHDVSLVLSGAVFDILVDMAQARLVEMGLIDRTLDVLSRTGASRADLAARVQGRFDMLYIRFAGVFRDALAEARDELCALLAAVLPILPDADFRFIDLWEGLLAVDGAITGGRNADAIDESFAWRGVGAVTLGPRLIPPGVFSHMHSSRTYVPEKCEYTVCSSYRDRMSRRGRI